MYILGDLRLASLSGVAKSVLGGIDWSVQKINVCMVIYIYKYVNDLESIVDTEWCKTMIGHILKIVTTELCSTAGISTATLPPGSLAQVFQMPRISRGNIWKVRSKFQAKSKGRGSGLLSNLSGCYRTSLLLRIFWLRGAFFKNHLVCGGHWWHRFWTRPDPGAQHSFWILYNCKIIHVCSSWIMFKSIFAVIMESWNTSLASIPFALNFKLGLFGFQPAVASVWNSCRGNGQPETGPLLLPAEDVGVS